MKIKLIFVFIIIECMNSRNHRRLDKSEKSKEPDKETVDPKEK